jgi:hypothetical protein
VVVASVLVAATVVVSVLVLPSDSTRGPVIILSSSDSPGWHVVYRVPEGTLLS